MPSSTTASTQSQMHHVVHLNEEGSSFLVDGKGDDAIEKYKEALGILKNQLQAEENAFVDNNNVEEDQDAMDGDDDDEAVLVPSLCISTVPFQPRPDAGQPFIYRNVVRYQETSGSTDSLDMKLLSAVVIYNMALFYHTSDLDHGTTVMQTSCMQLYDMCLDLLERIPQGRSECIILRAICLNNMAHVAFERDDYPGARTLLDHLMFTMNQDVSRAFFDERDVQGFVLNCMLMRPPTVARAA
jgi:hypothetical protein